MLLHDAFWWTSHESWKGAFRDKIDTELMLNSYILDLCVNFVFM